MRMKRKCELCSNIATIYCDSDEASLCNECDSKVHGANFLVAKHSRTLLCHVCQSPTLWTGSGPKFGPTISVCPTCLSSSRDDNVARRSNGLNNGDSSHEDGEDLDDYDGDRSAEDDDDADDDGDSDDGCEDDDSHNGDGDDDDDDDEENQVVPWSFSVSRPR